MSFTGALIDYARTRRPRNKKQRIQNRFMELAARREFLTNPRGARVQIVGNHPCSGKFGNAKRLHRMPNGGPRLMRVEGEGFGVLVPQSLIRVL